MNKTKIIATIGPSSSSHAVLKKMITAGMNVARLNFSHGSYSDHEKVINLIRSLSREMNRPVAILLDLQGPKIRVGNLEGGKPVMLKKNRSVTITTENKAGTAEILTTTYKNFPNDVKPGSRVLLDKGRWKGITKDEDWIVLRKDAGKPADVDGGMVYSSADYLGTVKIGEISEPLSEGLYTAAGDFSFIGPGDELFLLPAPDINKDSLNTPDPAFKARLLAIP